MERALAHWLNTMHPTPGNTASDRLGDAAQAIEPKDTWTPVSADEAERVVRALVDEAAVGGTRATASEGPGAESPSRGYARPKAALAAGALIFLVATVVILALISRIPPQSDGATASLAGQAPPHGHPSSPGEAAHNPIHEQEQEMNRATVAAAAAGLIIAGESFAQSAVQWRVEDGGNGHWYQVLVSPTNVSWFEARGRAQDLGGHLATLTTSDENRWAHAITVNAAGAWGAWNGGWEFGPWIGGYRASPSDVSWKWVTAEPWDFTAWHPSQPDSAQQTAVSFGGGGPTSAVWADTNVDEPVRSFVVEWSADCNSDGIVDYGQILAGDLADANSNGIPDVCEVPSCIDADLNPNGIVDGADLGALLAFWGPVSPAFPRADINGDGNVNGADLGILLSLWGPCGG